MSDTFFRTEMLLGEEAMQKLKNSKVLIFGLGGVGSSAALAIARCGVGKMVIVDNDTVNETNINRQAIAFHSTIGRPKTEVTKEFILDINPEAEVTMHQVFVLPDNLENVVDEDVDYIIDAIDTVSAKIAIAELAERKNIPLISCMGTGNKLDPFAFKIADISKTQMCPLCKVMRKELKNIGIGKLKVLYSEEVPLTPKKEVPQEEAGNRRGTPGSISFVPPTAGLMLAAEVVKALAGVE
ncbi:MAG: tRNA threonylcarbamoyladenosine dehydratase [Lachnospiraceae bacterium]|nr:tRNA threonylcarbamoyladenosine dehydratase [Lachnospiraceae bacterium]